MSNLTLSDDIISEISIALDGKCSLSIRATALMLGIDEKALRKSFATAGTLSPSELAQSQAEKRFDPADFSKPGIPDPALCLFDYMDIMNELVFLESHAARQDRIADLDDARALEVINKAKALLMATWQGTGIATTQQMAEYYEVSEDTVGKVYRRNKDELLLDGAKVLRGKDLKAVVSTIDIAETRVDSETDIMSVSESRRTSLLIWTPRAALRLGMLLRDSLVAQQVRTLLLDIAASQPKNFVVSQNLKALPLPPISPRNQIRKLVNDYAFFTGFQHERVYRKIYMALIDHYDYDAWKTTKPKGNKLDQIEADGQLQNLLVVANHYLQVPANLPENKQPDES